MAATVDPFSIATAELSKDYIKTFPNPDIVPKYLDEIRDRADVVVFAVDNCINIKGSWISLERARLLLTEFLTTYHVDDKKDFDLFGNESESPPFSGEVDSNNEEEEEDHKPNSVSRFQDTTNEPSDWVKWTTEVLPQIQPVRSKRLCDCDYNKRKSEANKIPEPLVLCANYQPTPDPTAKIPPTLDAIEKVLKTVYDTKKEKNTLSESAPASKASSYSVAHEHIDHEKLQNESITELNHDSTADLSIQSQAEDNFVSLGSDHTLKERQTNSEPPSPNQEDQETLEVDAAISSSLLRDEVTGTELSLHQEVELGSINTGQSHFALAKELSEENPRTRRQRRKTTKSGRNNDNSFCKDSGDADTFTECESKELVENDNRDEDLNQAVSEVKESRRKGRPRKNKAYLCTTVQACEKKFQPETPKSCILSSRIQRTSKRKSQQPVEAVFTENSPVHSVKKKSGRPRQYTQEVVSKVHVEGKGYVCELCPYVAQKFKHLLEHKRRVHNHEGKGFKCEECGKIFGFGKDLKRHYLSHQRAENCCDICGKMYKGVRNLAEHKKTHETNYIKPEFPCEFCQKIFSTKYVLAYHIKSDHLGMKRTYICPTCGKSFSQKNSYLQHANVHMGIKPYQCDICGRSFSYEKSLKEHKYMHQDGKQFECPVCHKKFRQSSGVAIHMKIHQERKDYVCSSCGKGFSQKQALIRHERIHAGDKPFTCSLCQRSFTDSSVLRRHMILIHKKDKDKWREDTESNLQRCTNFFISVVDNGLSEKDPESQKSAGTDAMTSNEQSLDQARVNPVTEPVRSGDDNNSSHTNHTEEFNFIPVGIGTVTSMPQASSSSQSVMTAMPSMSLPHCPQYRGGACAVSNPGITLSDSAHGPLPAVHKLESEAVFRMPAESAGSAFSESQSALQSSHNKIKAILQEQTSGVLNPYTFSNPSTVVSPSTFSGELQPDSSSVAGAVHYPAMVGQDSADYHSNLVLMSDALDTLHYHSGAMNVASSSQGQTADCDGLVTDSSVLQP